VTGKQIATLAWLIPEQVSYNRLHSIIAKLARHYDASVFEPHLTLGRIGERPLEEITFDSGPITLEAIGIFSSQVFTKTLFLRFASTPALQELRSSLGLNAEGYDPHLSLLYCKLPPGEGERLEVSTGTILHHVTFDRFSVVRCLDPTVTSEDVEAWQQLDSGFLAGG